MAVMYIQIGDAPSLRALSQAPLQKCGNKKKGGIREEMTSALLGHHIKSLHGRKISTTQYKQHHVPQ